MHPQEMIFLKGSITGVKFARTSSKVLLEHLGRGENSSVSALGHLVRGDRSMLGWLG